MFQFLKPWGTPVTDIVTERHDVLMRIRGHLAFFGYDASDMTDDELEALLQAANERLVRASNAMGATAEQVMKMSRAFRMAGKSHQDLGGAIISQ